MPPRRDFCFTGISRFEWAKINRKGREGYAKGAKKLVKIYGVVPCSRSFPKRREVWALEGADPHRPFAVSDFVSELRSCNLFRRGSANPFDKDGERSLIFFARVKRLFDCGGVAQVVERGSHNP